MWNLWELIWLESLGKWWWIQDKLLAAKSREKKYMNRKINDMKFWVSDYVLLKVPPMKGVMMFGKKNKIRPFHIGRFEIPYCVGAIVLLLSTTTQKLVWNPPSISCVYVKYIP